MTGRDAQRDAALRMERAGIHPMDARATASWFFAAAAGALRESELHAAWEAELDQGTQLALERMLSRRLDGEPAQYILRTAPFMGLDFYVTEHVLIPRQDTETLCEAALSKIRPGMRVLDLCTGSGALAVAIKKLCPGAQVTATDISGEALDVARENASRLCVDVEFYRGDLFAALPEGSRFDVIVSNPPYINDRDMLALPPEVKREPELALRGGADGLDVYRRIAAGLGERLAPGGVALLEVGYNQSAAVRELLRAAIPDGEIGTINDLSGIERVVFIQRTV